MPVDFTRQVEIFDAFFPVRLLFYYMRAYQYKVKQLGGYSFRAHGRQPKLMSVLIQGRLINKFIPQPASEPTIFLARDSSGSNAGIACG
jgi:hypothetical protein